MELRHLLSLRVLSPKRLRRDAIGQRHKQEQGEAGEKKKKKRRRDSDDEYGGCRFFPALRCPPRRACAVGRLRIHLRDLLQALPLPAAGGLPCSHSPNATLHCYACIPPAGSSDDDSFYDRTAKGGAGFGASKKGKAGGAVQQQEVSGDRSSPLIASAHCHVGCWSRCCCWR